MTAEFAEFRNLRRLMVYDIMPHSRPIAGLKPHHRARAIAREWNENILWLKRGVKFHRLMMSVEIERLVPDDEFRRVNDKEEWSVCLRRVRPGNLLAGL